MTPIKIETTIQQDGELRLTELPFRKGDRVEATLLAVHEDKDVKGNAAYSDDANLIRKEALERFLARAAASTFRSVGPYPSRDELHERR